MKENKKKAHSKKWGKKNKGEEDENVKTESVAKLVEKL